MGDYFVVKNLSLVLVVDVVDSKKRMWAVDG